MNPTGNPTTDALLGALRRKANQPAMTWSCPPVRLAGGFWAEMYLIELTGAPSGLDGRLVARVVPDADTAAYETAIQRYLTRCGFPVPPIPAATGRAATSIGHGASWTSPPGSRYSAGSAQPPPSKRRPTLLRRLPDLLAEAASTLHQSPLDGLHSELTNITRQPDIHHVLDRTVAQANVIGRHDLARIAEHLAATAHDERVICHGDLHPFNLLVDGDRWTLIDWSTAVLADPHYDLAFTTLMLSNPPVGGPAPVRTITRTIGSRLAHRFLRDGTTIKLCRLRYGGSAHLWGFAIYRASHDDYQETFLPNGMLAGTAEDAVDCACGLYLNDPTAWLPDTPTN